MCSQSLNKVVLYTEDSSVPSDDMTGSQTTTAGAVSSSEAPAAAETKKRTATAVQQMDGKLSPSEVALTGSFPVPQDKEPRKRKALNPGINKNSNSNTEHRPLAAAATKRNISSSSASVGVVTVSSSSTSTTTAIQDHSDAAAVISTCASSLGGERHRQPVGGSKREYNRQCAARSREKRKLHVQQLHDNVRRADEERRQLTEINKRLREEAAELLGVDPQLLQQSKSSSAEESASVHVVPQPPPPLEHSQLLNSSSSERNGSVSEPLQLLSMILALQQKPHPPS